MKNSTPIKVAARRSGHSGLWMLVWFIALVIGLAWFNPAKAAECGIASWYGYTGATTASGDPYNGSGMTAAHKTLPFGTIVRVTDKATGKSITVRINDRGPFVKGRILDLSKEAGGHFGLTNRKYGRGITKVCFKILQPP